MTRLQLMGLKVHFDLQYIWSIHFSSNHNNDQRSDFCGQNFEELLFAMIIKIIHVINDGVLFDSILITIVVFFHSGI